MHGSQLKPSRLKDLAEEVDFANLESDANANPSDAPLDDKGALPTLVRYPLFPLLKLTQCFPDPESL